jgi:hypothetical protein
MNNVSSIKEDRMHIKSDISLCLPRSISIYSEKYLTHHFKEDGNYTIHVKYDRDDNIICIFRLTNAPRSAYIRKLLK